MVAKRRKRSPGKPPDDGRVKALAPDAAPSEPGQGGPNIVFVRQVQAGVRVTEDTALTLGAVFACVRVITEDTAGLPWRVHESRPGGGSDERPDDPSDWLIHTQANPETPAFQWRETTVAHALTWGNGYSEIERDGAGRPVWLWQLTPDRVEPARFQGRIVYEVANPRQSNTVLEAEDVFHLRGLGFDGLVGYSVVRLAARSIGLGISLDDNAANFYANDSTPGGVLTHPGRLTQQARTNLEKSWQTRHGGPGKRRTVAILEEGMGWEQTGLPPEDAQLLGQKQLTPAEICRWFRVKPHKIADLTRSTFSNIEEENISHVTDTLLPWVRRLEQEANIKLFGRTNRGRRFTKVNLQGLLRGNAAARSAYYTAMFNIGVLSDNDIRTLEDMNPIGPDGDKRFVPLNMQLLEQAGEEPPAPETPSPPSGQETPPEDMPDEEGMMRVLAPVLADACERVWRRQAREGSGTLGEATVSRLAAYARDSLAPAVAALATAAKASSKAATTALAAVVEDYARRLASDPAARIEPEQVRAALAAALTLKEMPRAEDHS